jgi:transposase
MEEITCKRRKRQGHREAQLKDLPVETIEYRLSRGIGGHLQGGK